MSYSAHLVGFDLDDILQIIGTSRKSGVVTVVCEGWGGKLVFRRGRVVHASSDSRAKLGHRLIQKGILTERQLRQALSEQQESSRPLASVLYQMGTVSLEVLERETRAHLVDVFKDMLGWKDGSVLFEPVSTPGTLEVLDKGVSVETLLLQSCVTEDRHQQVEREVDEFTQFVGYYFGD